MCWLCSITQKKLPGQVHCCGRAALSVCWCCVLQADNKLAAARLMRDIAELRQRVSQVEARLAHELKVPGGGGVVATCAEAGGVGL